MPTRDKALRRSSPTQSSASAVVRRARSSSGRARTRAHCSADEVGVSLNARTWLALVVVTLVMCALLFGSAGTIRYWQAWGYVAIFVVACVPTSIYLMKKDRALLARWMRGGPMFEKEG